MGPHCHSVVITYWLRRVSWVRCTMMIVTFALDYTLTGCLHAKMALVVLDRCLMLIDLRVDVEN